MHKEEDDVLARSVAENRVGDMFAEVGGSIGDRESDVSAARGLLRNFPAVRFERVTSKVRGSDGVPLRRLVITGPWEVDPGGN